MEHFNAGDWLIIAIYLMGIMALGLWFGRDQHTTRDYFLGSKNVPWWAIGLSIVAAETSALTIIGVPAMAYGGDLAFIQMVLGYALARVILAVALVPHYFKGEIYSPYQLLGDAFGPSARQTAGAFFLISETLAAGVRVYVASIPIQLMFGEKVLGATTKYPLQLYESLLGRTVPPGYAGDAVLGAIWLFVLLSLVYTYVGGVKAVIWTDALQFALFLAGGLFTLGYVSHLVPGGMSRVVSEAARAGKLHWFNGHFSFSLPFNIWMGLIGAVFVTLSSHGAEQLIVQRVLACKSVGDGRKALILSALLILPLFLIFLLVGAMLWVYYQHFSMLLPIPEARPGIKANDFIYPVFMLTAVPHWLRGFLIVAILSAAMSSVSSALTSLASVSTMDFLRPLIGGQRGERFYLTFSKISTVAWAGALIVVAYLSRKVVFVLNAAFSLRGLTSGALLGGLLLCLVWKKGRAAPLVLGMMMSLSAMVAVSVWTRIDWPWLTLLGTATTLGAAWLFRAALPSGAAIPAAPTMSSLGTPK
jgi:SSS family solute:Na+ symporter